jgi:rhodanese-related sulfurtransferase
MSLILPLVDPRRIIVPQVGTPSVLSGLNRVRPGSRRLQYQCREGLIALRERIGMADHPRRAIDELLAESRARLVRLSPHAAFEAQQHGAVLVDIRPQASREADGELPGAVVIERTVLEWRLDPACAHRLPFAAYDLQVVVVCNEGYSSSLAAATLQNLGITRATDLDGGFRAWKAHGLPVWQAPASGS